MRKYSFEKKLEVVKCVLEKNYSMNETAIKYGISRGDVQKWVNAYENHGENGILTPKNQCYTGDFKVTVVEYMRNTCSSARKTAAYFNIPTHNTVCMWKRIYLEEGANALYENRKGRPIKMSKKGKKGNQSLKKEVKEDLIAEVQRLRMENEYLKKLNALIQQKEKSATKTKR